MAWQRRTRIRHIRLIGSNLVFPPAQLHLFEAERAKTAQQENIISVIDKIRNRFGNDAIQMGRTLAA